MSTAPPRVGRPRIPDGYGVPPADSGVVLPWSWAQERLERALLYWVATTRPDSRPHVIPIWGAWLDDTFFFEGGSTTRWARNLRTNLEAVVLVQEGHDDVVMVEGAGRELRPATDLAERVAAAFGKYREPYSYTADPAEWTGGGLWALPARVARGWPSLDQATSWWFGDRRG